MIAAEIEKELGVSADIAERAETFYHHTIEMIALHHPRWWNAAQSEIVRNVRRGTAEMAGVWAREAA